jgi:solute:Na+ symporter, SSS family
MISYTSVSIFSYFALLIFIGFYAMRKSTADNNEYLLGGRKVSAKVTALSAGASDMSGWMLMGLPGAAYISGLSSIWLAFGLIIGAYVNYQIVAPKLRIYTELADDSLTIPEFLSKRFGLDKGAIRIVASLIIIIFFTLYTASGLVAGGKLFETAFELSYQVGIVATVSIVVIYTVMGGFLAVSISDFVQGIIMLIALIAVPVMTFNQLELSPFNVNSSALNQEALTSSISFAFSDIELISTLSLLTWGLGYFGQPHIIVRFMAINSHKNLPKAKRIGLSWMTLSIIGALVVGWLGAKFIQQTQATLDDPETIFIYLGQVLFHPLIAGWVLAAILAAIMSTISSQLLVSSSSLVEDIYKVYAKQKPTDKKLLLTSRLCVVIVAVAASIIAFDSNTSVLGLVSNAWAGFGAAFGPLIILSLWWKPLTHKGAVAAMVAGAVTVMVWAYLPVLDQQQTLSSLFYELLPGFMVSSLVAVIVSLKTDKPKASALNWFDLVSVKLNQK